MTAHNARARRRWLFFQKFSFYFKAAVVAVAGVAMLAGYVRLRIERVSLAYQMSENLLMERTLAEQVATAELRYNTVFSSARLIEAAKRRGFREPGRDDFIYDGEGI